ncbi:MAG TPA: pyridoxamine 5'-phosphate oxidase family protein [Candidatus Saccharimonadales bacterium]|nr:pyridoxamine 5'-phosphate oxidase family protein [Candidatus Saccharimonadales bacterium]
MQATDYIKQYLTQQHLLQLATLAGDQPWCCTVYFVADADYNLYWASWPTRRHSREIVAHHKVAAAVAATFVKGKAEAGVQLEGVARQLESSDEIRLIAQLYAAKFDRSTQWIEDITANRTKHRLYKFTPSRYVIFDEVHFSGDEARQEFASLA